MNGCWGRLDTSDRNRRRVCQWRCNNSFLGSLLTLDNLGLRRLLPVERAEGVKVRVSMTEVERKGGGKTHLTRWVVCYLRGEELLAMVVLFGVFAVLLLQLTAIFELVTVGGRKSNAPASVARFGLRSFSLLPITRVLHHLHQQCPNEVHQPPVYPHPSPNNGPSCPLS